MISPRIGKRRGMCDEVSIESLLMNQQQPTTQTTAPKTVRILSLDGGGMRGYLSATFLQRFCQEAGINPQELFNHFDIITGTSIGGIQALAYAYGLSPENMLGFFASEGAKIFAYDSVLPLPAYKASVLLGLPTYPLTFYRQEPLKAALEAVFGVSLQLSDLPGKVIIPSWQAGKNTPLIFSNIPGFEPFLTGLDTEVVRVGLATSAAPLYFPSASGGGQTLLDGGVYHNNPVTSAFAVAKQLSPASTRACVLSVGTGLAHTAFIPKLRAQAGGSLEDQLLRQEVKAEIEKLRQKLLRRHPHHRDQVNRVVDTALMPINDLVPYNVEYLFYLMDNVFITGPQELNAKLMALESQNLYEEVFSYRFQYQFLEGQDASLDNYAPEQLAALAQYAEQQYERDRFLIENFISHFKAG